MAFVLYEHPLNERIRNYLKLEQLFAHANECVGIEAKLGHQLYFQSLFSILDTLERNDIRGDLIKDLEKLEQNLVVWSKSPEVNDSALQDTLQQTISLLCQLKSNNANRQPLKDDKFLSSLKQRFAIQGGSACFDLPQLHYWLSHPSDKTSAQMQAWLNQLDEIYRSLFIILKFIRIKSNFTQIETDKGFFQESGEGLSLLRIKVQQSAEHYPTVSGNRFRYSIRFMCPCEKSGRQYCDTAITFELARC